MRSIKFFFFRTSSYFFLSIFIYCLLYSIVTPPFYVADEHSHFQKSSSKETLYLRGSLRVDKSIYNFSENFEKMANDRQHNGTKYDKNFLFKNYDTYNLNKEYKLGNLSNLSGYPVTGYLFSKISFITSKLFSDNVTLIFYIGRIVNIIFSIIILIYVTRKIFSNSSILLLIYSSPMALSILASHSQDVMIFNFTLLFIFFSDYLLKKKETNLIKTELFIFLASLMCVLLIFARPTYIPIFLLPILLTYKISSKKNYQYILIVILIIISLIFILTYDTVPKKNNLSFPQDIFFVIELLMNDLIKNTYKYFYMMIGAIGRIDIFADYKLIYLFLIIFFYAFLTNFDFKNILTNISFCVFLIFFLIIFLTQLAQYIYFTETGRTDYIQGVQGRYFIPAFMILTLLLKNNSNKILILVEKIIILLVPHLNIFMIIKTYNFFY